MAEWLRRTLYFLAQETGPTLKFSALAVAAGGLLFVLGVVGLALLANGRRADAQGGPPRRRRFLTLLAALCLSVGVLVLLVMAVTLPVIFQRYDARRQLDTIARIESERLSMSLLSQPKYRDPKRLNPYQFKIFSQHGEDGILAEIFRRIGTTNRKFVEFGAADGFENNTTYLVRTGWGGLWMDGDPGAVRLARSNFAVEVAEGRLTVLEAFITAENIEELFAKGGVPEEPDLLSIDIDRNDYHVWKNIKKYRPRCVVIEYNGSFAPTVSWVVPYDPKAWGLNGFGAGNGASLGALVDLAREKGYSLVNCELAGVNAFFVRDDLLKDHFAAPFTAENHYEPFRHFQLRTFNYARGLAGPPADPEARSSLAAPGG